MGTDKALLQRDGSTYVDLSARRLAAICREVWYSGHRRPSETSIRASAWVEDRTPGLGPVGGVTSVLRLAKSMSLDACLITPTDMPDLRVPDLRSLVEAWAAEPNQPVCSACAETGRLQPLVAIYPTSSLASLEDLAASGDRSLSRWFAATDHLSVAIPPASCRNINRPEDLEV